MHKITQPVSTNLETFLDVQKYFSRCLSILLENIYWVRAKFLRVFKDANIQLN